MMTQKLAAGVVFPELVAMGLDGARREIARPAEGVDWMMVVVYRGRHCPLCTRYLNELEGFKARLWAIGVDLVAVSGDSAAQLEAHRERLQVSFPLFYGLTTDQMEALGLYVSMPRSVQETDHPFPEPGLFVINAEGRVQVVDLSNNPFVRPDLESLVSGLEWIRKPENDYPIRGMWPEG